MQVKIRSDVITLIRVNDGATGPQGVSVVSSVDEWYLSTASDSATGGSWSETRQAWSQRHYYWRRVKTTYSDKSTRFTPSTSGYYDFAMTQAVSDALTAKTTADTAKSVADTAQSTANTAIKSVEIQYAQNTSQTEVPSTGWQTDAPAWKEGSFIWQRTATTTADGTVSYSAALCITGIKGDDAVSLYVESSNGTAFKNTAIATTLTVDIYVGGELITDSEQLKKRFGDEAYLQWRQKPEGSTSWLSIPSTDSRLSDHGFIFTLNANDVQDRTVFSCDLIF